MFYKIYVSSNWSHNTILEVIAIMNNHTYIIPVHILQGYLAIHFDIFERVRPKAILLNISYDYPEVYSQFTLLVQI